MQNKKEMKGFTLIEMLVVVLIIGILAAVALPQYKRVKEKTIMTEGMQLAKQIAEANQRYYLVNNEYADDIRNLDIEFSGEVVTFSSSKRIKTKNFLLSSRANGSNNSISVIQRLPAATKYYISIYKSSPNIIRCNTYTDGETTLIEKELCDKLNTEGHL